MKQGKPGRFLWILLAVLCMTGCGKEEDKKENPPETVLAASQQYVLSDHEASGSGSILLGDTLYYLGSIYADGGEERTDKAVYRKMGEQEAELLAEFPWPEQALVHYLADWDGAVYYLYIEAEETEGGADYKMYLQKDGAAGDVEYRVPVDEEQTTVPEGGALWDGFPEGLSKWFTVIDGAADAEGRLCLYSRHGLLFLFDSSGSLVCEKECRTREGKGDAGVVNAGSYGCYLYETGDEKAAIRKIDMQTGELSSEEELPFRPEEICSVLNGYDDGILINTEQSLYCCKPAGDAELLLDWGDFFLYGNSVLQACLDGDGFRFFVRDKNGLKQMRAERREAADFPGKQAVTLGISADGDGRIYRELAAEFNEASPDYQIEIVEIAAGSRDEFNDLYMQLLKGGGPDVLALTSLLLPVNVLADKGVLEDLTPYFEQSKSVQMEDILPRVVEAGSHQGKFVSLIPMFTMQALAVRQGYAKDCGWTQEEFLAYAAEHPDSALYQKETSCRSLLDDLMAGDMEGYIDWEKRECSFHSERFIRLLESVKNANTSAGGTEGEAGYEGFLAGDYLAVQVRVPMPETYADAVEYMEGYGELAGYPASSGEARFLLSPHISLGINSRAECREGAWAFLEYTLSVDFRNREGTSLGSLPSLISRFERRLEENERALHPDDDVVVRSNYFTYEVMENVPFPEITEEMKEVLRFMADHLHYDARIGRDAEYKTIILEEADAYFAGDKTAEEAAELIQNRVSLFLGE